MEFSSDQEISDCFFNLRKKLEFELDLEPDQRIFEYFLNDLRKESEGFFFKIKFDVVSWNEDYNEEYRNKFPIGEIEKLKMKCFMDAFELIVRSPYMEGMDAFNIEKNKKYAADDVYVKKWIGEEDLIQKIKKKKFFFFLKSWDVAERDMLEKEKNEELSDAIFSSIPHSEFQVSVVLSIKREKII